MKTSVLIEKLENLRNRYWRRGFEMEVGLLGEVIEKLKVLELIRANVNILHSLTEEK